MGRNRLSKSKSTRSTLDNHFKKLDSSSNSPNKENDAVNEVASTNSPNKENDVVNGVTSTNSPNKENGLNGVTSSNSPNKENEAINREVTEFKEVDGKKRKHSETNGDAAECKKAKTEKENILSEKCLHCRKKLDDPNLRLFLGDPDDAVEEPVMLADPRLSLFTGNSNEDDEFYDQPQHKITNFSIFDASTHLCPFDSGLIESDVHLYMSGIVKPIYDEDPSPKDGIPTRNIGPLNSWWMSGFDGGEKAVVGFGTAFCEYVLMNPSEEYAPFMEEIKEKIYLSKAVMEFLLEEPEGAYEDLLNHIQTVVPPQGVPSFTEDSLFKYAQFIIDQIQDYDSCAEEYDLLLITTPCVRGLIKLVGLTVGKRRRAFRPAHSLTVKRKEETFMKATTTPLVFDVFETLFREQLDDNKEKRLSAARKKRCGICDVCLAPDCGKCRHCKDMVKFGGSGKSKQACSLRRCPNMAIEEAENDYIEDDEDRVNKTKKLKKNEDKKRMFRAKKKNAISWIGDPATNEEEKVYQSVSINGEEVKTGDFVLVSPLNPQTPVFVAHVVRLWETKEKEKKFHAHWFCRSSSTVLGEIGDPLEVFMSEECEDTKLDYVMCKCAVVYNKPSPSWFSDGGKAEENPLVSEDGKSFFCQKWYHHITARFDDLPEEVELFGRQSSSDCMNCIRLNQLRELESPKLGDKLEEKNEKLVLYESVQFRDQEYRIGSCIYLLPDAYFLQIKSNDNLSCKNKDVDEDIYPEYYRKTDYVKGSNLDVQEPFRIACIKKIFRYLSPFGKESKFVSLLVTKFFRPEDTCKGVTACHQSNLNQLYWTDEEAVVKFSMVQGKCYVVYGGNVTENIDVFCSKGPNRFFFDEAYNIKFQKFEKPPEIAQGMGKKILKGKGKGKGKKSTQPKVDEELETYPEISEKLRMLDVFAGCGGLTEGFHRVGLADSHWAIEKEQAAANAYKINFPNCTVFTEDCNNILKRAMEGFETDSKGQKLPKRGEVDLLCGGPPCQGFSGMNRFNSRQYSSFKNSLIVTYLSYCDFYRPRFFLLENVRNFVSFKNNVVLKLTLASLLKMGYQVTFGVLQAGSYGVPQTRRRAIILAAAPGEKLPLYPEPTHVFTRRACSLTVSIGDLKFESNIRWNESAPYRTVTVRDAMSDLPKIKNGAKVQEISYGGEAISHFQRQVRGSLNSILRDHICKEMSALVAARMSHIPVARGSDWRDLPNLVISLSDGTHTKKLVYTHRDSQQDESECRLRGVCACATGDKCDPQNKQEGTLIPWCLPHTGNRHSNWAGLYGRLENDGFFSTTVTNPEPMGKQGRVLHPEQNRVVSVRECARSQGFPDSFRFYGNILEKHRQVGNAVPPPLAAAIGIEIMKSLASLNPLDTVCS